MAIDDEPLALKQIAGYIDRTPFLEAVALCENALQAMEALEHTSVALMFVDINMPGLSGMDFVKAISPGPAVVFTTAYSEFAIEGYKVDALDYLLKPFGYEEFLRVAMKAKKRLEQEPGELQLRGQHLFIKSGHRIVRAELSDIRYIEGEREYVRFHLANAKPVMALASLKKLEASLPAGQFMRVHRSYIVNLQQIMAIDGNRIAFGDEAFIPVGEQYREAFRQYVERYFL